MENRYEDLRDARRRSVVALAETVLSGSSRLSLLSYDAERFEVAFTAGASTRLVARPYADGKRGPRIVVFSTGSVATGLPFTLLPSPSECVPIEGGKGLDVCATLVKMSGRGAVARIEAEVSGRAWLVERFVPERGDTSTASDAPFGWDGDGCGDDEGGGARITVRRDMSYLARDWKDAVSWCGMPDAGDDAEGFLADAFDGDGSGGGGVGCACEFAMLESALPSLEPSSQHAASLSCIAIDGGGASGEDGSALRIGDGYAGDEMARASAFYRISKTRAFASPVGTARPEFMLAADAIERYGGSPVRVSSEPLRAQLPMSRHEGSPYGSYDGDGIGAWSVSFSMDGVRGIMWRDDQLSRIYVETDASEETIVASYSGTVMSALRNAYPLPPSEKTSARMSSELRELVKRRIRAVARGNIGGCTLLVLRGTDDAGGRREVWMDGRSALERRLPVAKADANPARWYATRERGVLWNRIRCVSAPMMAPGSAHSTRIYDAKDLGTGEIWRDAVVACDVAVKRYRAAGETSYDGDEENGEAFGWCGARARRRDLGVAVDVLGKASGDDPFGFDEAAGDEEDGAVTETLRMARDGDGAEAKYDPFDDIMDDLDVFAGEEDFMPVEDGDSAHASDADGVGSLEGNENEAVQVEDGTAAGFADEPISIDDEIDADIANSDAAVADDASDGGNANARGGSRPGVKTRRGETVLRARSAYDELMR